MTDLIKCPQCGELFNPAYLDLVAKHMHEGVKLTETFKGERVMINPKDLRIGNYILLDTGLFLPQWHCVMPKDIYDISEGKVTLESIEGIPLTPEILEKCGFEQSQSENVEERQLWSRQVANNTSLYFDNTHPEDKTWYLSHYYNNNHYENDFWNKPQFLHQLQNLYYALTGQELEVNL